MWVWVCVGVEGGCANETDRGVLEVGKATGQSPPAKQPKHTQKRKEKKKKEEAEQVELPAALPALTSSTMCTK